MSLESMVSYLGSSIDDADEEIFLLFSHDLPSNNLGFVDAKAENLEIEIDGHNFELFQSPGLLTSNRETGTTGAVLWKISPKIAAWLASLPRLLTELEALHPNAAIVELGCGITGIIGQVLAPKVHQYILTDQAYVLTRLRENITANTKPDPRRPSQHHLHRGPKTSVKRKESVDDKLMVMNLDWEQDSVNNLKTLLTPSSRSIDLVIVSDCIYNEYLIQPLRQVCVQLCQLNQPSETSTIILFAQQLRSDEIMLTFLKSFLSCFHLWRIPDADLSEDLRLGSGYAVHLAVLKAELQNH